MALAIDWDFIASPAIEGRNLVAVVPDASHSNSGVTVGLGVDLGQMTSGEMMALGLPQPLLIKCISYAGLRGMVAAKALAAQPLALTSDECALLEAPKKRAVQVKLSLEYLKAAASPFEELPQGVQTVLASLTWQYGDMPTRTPRTWAAAVRKDWVLLGADLANFGDRYPARHIAEAAYLKAHLT